MKQREMLEMRRRTLQESIASRRRYLSSLPAQLKAVKKAAHGLQQVGRGDWRGLYWWDKMMH